MNKLPVFVFEGAQKSPEWFAHRRGKITSSIASAILGNNPYKSRKAAMANMLRDMCGVSSIFEGNEATRYGEEQESLARKWYERKRRVSVVEVGGIGSGDYFVSPDGLVGDQGSIEIKAPFSGDYRSLDEAAYYRDQIQLMLHVSCRTWCDFIIWRGPSDVMVQREFRDATWFDRNREVFSEFIAERDAILADPRQLAEYMPKDEREDTVWHDAVDSYRECAADFERAQDNLEAARDRLQLLAPNGAKGFGLSLAKVERAGSISYAQAIKKLCPDADLEPFRGKASVYYRVDDTNV